MTKINRITMHGFKSFAHKTDIPFEDKYNVILGPNGSGKSNVGDAICFVLGKLSAKSMRAEKAANLIFNGGKKKRPSGEGTVEIAFCNKNKLFPDNAKEAVVSRTITSKGSSIYKINGKKRTRTEVLDYLATAKINPDGYNIILQGDITRFVDMPHVERRKIIEEISDVSIYEEKKHKALLELNRVDEKLGNADIILKERKTYLKELKKDRDQAMQFKELKDKIDSNKATFVHVQMQSKLEEKAKFDAQISKHEETIKKSEGKIEELKAQIVAQKENISSINKEIEQKGEKQQVEVHKNIEDLKVTLAGERARISTLKDEINKIAQRKDQFKEEMKELNEKSSSHSNMQKDLSQQQKLKQRELQIAEKNIADFKKKHKIEASQSLDQEVEEKDTLIEQKQEEVQKMRQEQQELLRDKDKLEYQIQTIDERITKVREVEKENKGQVKQLQQHKTNFKSATLRLNKLLDDDSSFASQVANARRNLQSLQEKHAELNAKALSFKASAAGNEAVKNILANKKKFKGVFGTVAELGQVNKKYALPLEMSAGGRMNNIIVADDKVAADCIKHLKNNKLGSASFIPLNKIRATEIRAEHKSLSNSAGAHDFAINLISYKPQFKKAFEYVFGNTLVVEDIETARSVGIGKVKMATLDGNMAEASGVMRGGFVGRRRSSSFAQKDSLEELGKVEAEVGQLQSVMANVQTKREANEQEIGTLRTHKAEIEGEIIKLEKTLHLDTTDLDANNDLKKELQGQLKDVDSKLSEVQKGVSTINRDLAGLKSKKQMLRSQVSELRNPRLLAQLRAFEESKQQSREDLLKLEAELKNTRVQMEQMFAPEQEKIQEIMKQHEKEEITFKEEMKTLARSISEKEKELTQREKASTEFYSKYKELFNKRESLGNEVSKQEADIESIRDRMRNSERELNMTSLRNAEIKAKLAGLEEEFGRYKNAKLIKNPDIPVLQREIAKFEVMINQMSAVNMKALEVYDQVETEYTKLVEKRDGLDIEKTDVMTLMNEIETKKKEHFMKAYNEVNTNFQRIFQNLFKKGKAFLQLNNPNKPFEDGLSVKVKLTGNRFMDLKSLSGGEKTLTALSFIFAIQEHQPASFYVLDEIDAALDKHNAETLSKLIRSYSDSAQYVVISHNDSVISEADTLYGVSMKEGVSKVTSLKI
jgi:chromosome segregation protein